MSLQKTNFIVTEWVGLEELRQGAGRSAARPRVLNTVYFAFLALLFGFPLPLFMAVLMSEVPRARVLQRARLSSCRRAAGRGGAAVEVLLQCGRGRACSTPSSAGSASPAAVAHRRGAGDAPSLVLEATWASGGRGRSSSTSPRCCRCRPELYDAAAGSRARPPDIGAMHDCAGHADNPPDPPAGRELLAFGPSGEAEARDR